MMDIVAIIVAVVIAAAVVGVLIWAAFEDGKLG